MYFLEISLNHCYYLLNVDTSVLAKDLAESLKLSNANVIICKNGDRFELYPIDVPFLSEIKLYFSSLSILSSMNDS